MAGVATAASQPGVSVVSMSWGFPEGQAVFASDEAAYDSVFNVPGVTFVASTGDYGAADPEYPALFAQRGGGRRHEPHAQRRQLLQQRDGVGLLLRAPWGPSSAPAAASACTNPSRPTSRASSPRASRTTPDVSLVADPATGAWIADPYNLDPSNPFEVVGGTSLSAPAWAGLLALANQGRAAAGESGLNSASPTETQQALYRLPQSDYNVISQRQQRLHRRRRLQPGDRPGDARGQSSLVPDLVAYQGPGTTYSGPTVAPLQNANLVYTGTSDGGPIDVFSVFDSLIVPASGNGMVQHADPGSDPGNLRRHRGGPPPRCLRAGVP